MIVGKIIGTISKGKVRAIVLTLFLCGISICCFSQTVVLKNNFLYDATLTPNLGIEVRLDDKWTAGLNVGYQPWPFKDTAERKLRHLLISPEARYWFCDVFSGWFMGANVFYSHFNVSKVTVFGLYPSMKNRRKQGDAFAGGIFGGYSWILGPRWSIEAEAGVDVGRAKYKEYDCVHCGEYYGENKKTFLAPKVGINIIYNIK